MGGYVAQAPRPPTGCNSCGACTTTRQALPSPRQVPALLNLVEPDRVLFGSDYCWTPPALADAHIAAVDAAESPAEGVTWRSLTTANAKRLFPGGSR
ncbi:hypothetical protein GCM10010244_66110 [Streptomyces coeruleorubidus]|nr:hypothetical protein GCM10010244_66110 [Streptomyces bellus]